MSSTMAAACLRPARALPRCPRSFYQTCQVLPQRAHHHCVARATGTPATGTPATGTPTGTTTATATARTARGPLVRRHLSTATAKASSSAASCPPSRPRATEPASMHPPPGDPYDAVIIGAGPGGLTAAGTLLDAGLTRICLVDPDFLAGRIHHKYREVPSNTKTCLFAQWATGTQPFARIVESAPTPNAYTRLLRLDQDHTCKLAYAVDVAQMLSDGLRQTPGVDAVFAKVTRLVRDGDVWRLPELPHVAAPRVVLAQGSRPRRFGLVDRYPNLEDVPLDVALKPSALRQQIPPGARVGVVGASHSAVLAMMNLYNLGPDVTVVNFYRSPLLYAEYKDGWILYDNTGLKGTAATWARDVLEPEKDPRIRRIHLAAPGANEDDLYAAELPNCTHLVSAIGYDINEPPAVEVAGRQVELHFDALSGRFKDLPGLYGAGIAWPERVTDPAGNVESAVGWAKFLRFCKKVAPEWVADK